MANINNLFAGFLGFILSMAMVYLMWNPVNDFIAQITTLNTELGIFLNVCWIILVVIVLAVVPITLSTIDDRGN